MDLQAIAVELLTAVHGTGSIAPGVDTAVYNHSIELLKSGRLMKPWSEASRRRDEYQRFFESQLVSLDDFSSFACGG